MKTELRIPNDPACGNIIDRIARVLISLIGVSGAVEPLLTRNAMEKIK